MISLKYYIKKIRWTSVAGFALLLFALIVIICSKTNSNTKENTATDIPSEKTTDITTINIEETTIAPTPETTSKNPKHLINFDASHPFFIKVNRAENFAIVYGLDKDGHYTIPYKAFICSTGLDPENTPLGVFDISDKYRWRLMVDGTYAQYAVRIYGQIMLHSVPYEEAYNDTLEYWEYNKLGEPASLGCVRFRVSAIKWIYDHCDEGTKVEIYSDFGETPPIPIPTVKKIKKKNPNKGWDPTDPDKNNPWSKNKKHK